MNSSFTYSSPQKPNREELRSDVDTLAYISPQKLSKEDIINDIEIKQKGEIVIRDFR